MKRILIVDQHPIMRLGLGQILRELSPSVAVLESDDVDRACAIMQRDPCDAVILDLELGQHDGIEFIKRIRRQHAGVAMLVFTAHPEHRYGVRALRAGAMGYVSRLSEKETLLLAVRKVLEGQHFISRELSEQLARQVSGRRGLPGHESLSDREHQIASLIARGHTASQMATDLNISVKTVHTHRSRALKKLDLRNNAELVHYAFRNGLVD